jgi:hypothetical protein
VFHPIKTQHSIKKAIKHLLIPLIVKEDLAAMHLSIPLFLKEGLGEILKHLPGTPIPAFFSKGLTFINSLISSLRI